MSEADAIRARAAAVAALPAGAQRYVERHGDLPPEDARGHRGRASDSSFYDEVCVTCGATDACPEFDKRCTRRLPDLPGGGSPPSPTDPTEQQLDRLRRYVEAGASAPEIVEVVRALVAGVRSGDLPDLPVVPPGDGRLLEEEAATLARLEAAATPGNVGVAPFVYGSRDAIAYLIVGRAMDDPKNPDFKNFAMDMRAADADYVAALVRADRRRRGKLPQPA